MEVVSHPSILSWDSMFARTAIAVLDQNANCGREQMVGKAGDPTFTVKVSVHVQCPSVLQCRSIPVAGVPETSIHSNKLTPVQVLYMIIHVGQPIEEEGERGEGQAAQGLLVPPGDLGARGQMLRGGPGPGLPAPHPRPAFQEGDHWQGWASKMQNKIPFSTCVIGGPGVTAREPTRKDLIICKSHQVFKYHCARHWKVLRLPS